MKKNQSKYVTYQDLMPTRFDFINLQICMLLVINIFNTVAWLFIILI